MKLALRYFFIAGLILCSALGWAQESKIVYVKMPAVNIRTGPGLNFDKAGVVAINTPLKIISREGDWYEVLIGDTLDGWIGIAYTSEAPLPALERDKVIFKEGDYRSRIRMVEKMSSKHSGAEFEFLKDVALNYQKYESDLEADKMVLKEIFRLWSEKGIIEAIGVLVYVLENDFGGKLGENPQASQEIKLAAKEALKILVRE